jgi:hypothetical protein
LGKYSSDEAAMMAKDSQRATSDGLFIKNRRATAAAAKIGYFGKIPD